LACHFPSGYTTLSTICPFEIPASGASNPVEIIGALGIEVVDVGTVVSDLRKADSASRTFELASFAHGKAPGV